MFHDTFSIAVIALLEVVQQACVHSKSFQKFSGKIREGMPTPRSDSKPKSRVRREMKNSWLELEAEDGSVYYANLVTKQTSWEAPPDAHLQTATAAAAEQKRSTPPGRSSSSWHMDWPEISETAPAAPAAPAAAPVGHSDEEERWSWLDGRSDASSFDGERSVEEDGDRGNLEDRRRPNSASFSSSFSSSTTARGSRGGDIDGPVLETVGDWVRTIDPSSKRCYWANPVSFSSCAPRGLKFRFLPWSATVVICLDRLPLLVETNTHSKTHKITQTRKHTNT
jgi:hypothetical protein